MPDVARFKGAELTKITDRVYMFRWTWDRSLVLLTDEGIVMTDPFNAEAAQALKAELARVAPGRPVRTMIYSHYHFDHVVGGAALKPQEVLAHRKCPEYWNDLSDSQLAKQVVPPTRRIEDDYDRLKAKYSHYRGFNEQGLFHITRAFSGAVLGY